MQFRLGNRRLCLIGGERCQVLSSLHPETMYRGRRLNHKRELGRWSSECDSASEVTRDRNFRQWRSHLGSLYTGALKLDSKGAIGGSNRRRRSLQVLRIAQSRSSNFLLRW
jgi:hypothetical protein